MKLEIFLLGPFKVMLDGQPITTFESDKVRALLAYLATEAAQPHRRGTLAGLFWPELTEKTARKNLRQALFNLRKVIMDAKADPPFLTVTRQTVQLNQDGNSWLDVTAFSQSLESLSQNGGSLNKIDSASVQLTLDLYQQDFMAGFALDDSEAFESWLSLKREYLRRLALNGFDTLISHYYRAEDYLTALQVAQQRLHLDVWYEATHQQVMELLAQTGQYQAALAQYERCCQLLRDELNVDPSPETVALSERIRAELVSRDEVIESVALVNPYKGLRAFQEADSSDFFGRAGFTEQLIKRLCEIDSETWESGFLAVVGSSGSGKSSAVRAGLIPALRQRDEIWQILEMVPSANPIIELGLALQPLTADMTDVAVEGRLQADVDGLQQLLQSATEPVLLFVDQFEELFTLVDADKVRTHFLDLLLTALKAPKSNLHVVITLRADFYDHTLHYPEFGRLLNQQAEVIFPLTSQELAQAITGPAERVGMRLEAGLVAAIVADLSDQPGMLPLLQYALTELFEQREGRELTLAAYQAIGGVSGALSRRADELYTSLAEPAQLAVRQLFLRLVAVGEGVSDARRRVSRLELLQVAKNSTEIKQARLTNVELTQAESVEADFDRLNQQIPTISSNTGDGQVVSPSTRLIETVLDNFSQYRLLTFDQDPTLGSPTVEIAHEALIEKWTRLQEWLQLSREDVLTHRRLLTLAEEWTQADQNPEFLTSGSRLAQFEAWAANTDLALTLLEKTYLQACLTAQQAQQSAEADRQAQELALEQQAKGRLQMLVTVLMIATLLASSLAFFALSQRNRAEQQTRLTTSRQLAAQALNVMERQYDLALLLAIEANVIEQTVEAESSLLAVLQTNPRLMTYLQGHPAAVNDLDISHDGRLMVSAGGEGHLQLWDTSAWQPITTLSDPNSNVTSAVFSPDGQQLISAGNDGLITFWDVPSWQPLGEPLSAPSGGVVSADISSDGRFLVVATDHALDRWDIQQETWLEPSLTGYEDYVYHVRYSSDGRWLTSAGEDDNLIVRDANTGKPTGETLPVGETSLKIDFSPDSRYLATGDSDGIIKIWNVETGQAEGKPFALPNNATTGLAYSPDGIWLAVGSGDGQIQLWHTQQQRLNLDWHGHAGVIWDIVFTADGQQMVTAALDGTIIVWDMTDTFLVDDEQSYQPARLGQMLHEADEAVVWSQLSQDSQWLGVAFAERQAQRLPLLTTTETLSSITLPLSDIEANVIYVTMQDDGTRIAIGFESGDIEVWDIAETGPIFKQQLTIPSLNPEPWLLTISPNGQWLMAVDKDGVGFIWNLEEHNTIVYQIDHEVIVTAEFSADNQTLVTGNEAGTVGLWDVTTGALLQSPLLGPGSWIWSVAISPDNRLVAAGDNGGAILIWDRASGQALGRPLVGHPEYVIKLAFTPDGRRLASGDWGGTVMLWDTETGQPLGLPFEGHADEITSLAYSADGRNLFSTSLDGQVMRWQIDLATWKATACRIADRHLTELEWNQYVGQVADYAPTC